MKIIEQLNGNNYSNKKKLRSTWIWLGDTLYLLFKISRDYSDPQNRYILK